MNTCETCRSSFVPSRRSTGRFCSYACWNASPRQRHMVTCPHCGTSFHGDKRRKYCSLTCKGLDKRLPRVSPSEAPPIGAAWLPLPGGHTALIDADDAIRAGEHGWVFNARRRCVQAPISNRTVKLHRFLVGAPEGLLVDHANGNVLDNRKANLRLATTSDNARNMRKGRGVSRFKGVSLDRLRGLWTAMISTDRRTRYIGAWSDEVTAALAYDEEARRAFGAFACVNFPKPGERSAINPDVEVAS